MLEPCPSPKSLKKITQLTTNINPETGEMPRECGLGNEPFQHRAYPEQTYTWKASALCSKPLYFEDERLERYGKLRTPLLQPVASGVRFFGSAVLLPYNMLKEPPGQCMYALGYYRPGSCVPRFRKQKLPLDIDGIVYEVGVVTGLLLLVP